MPGYIQPYGALLTFEPVTGTVINSSTNLGKWISLGTVPAFNRSLTDLLGESAVTAIENVLAGRGGNSVYHQIIDLPAREEYGQEIALEATVYSYRDNHFVELEPAVPNGKSQDWAQATGETINTLRDATDLGDLIERIVTRVKRLIRFDRVMVYQFASDWHGHVIADAHERDMESMQDLHFPASDIPAQARELYLSNLVRYIPDVDYEPVPVIPWLGTDKQRPLDMSHVRIRSVSPIHLQYLRNMTVCSTVTISLIVDNQLWGMVACHHRTATALPIRLRQALSTLSITMGYMIGWHEQLTRATANAAQVLSNTRITEAFNQTKVALPGIIEQCGTQLLRLANAIGGALWVDDGVLPFGQWPEGIRGDSIVTFARDSLAASNESALYTEYATLTPALNPGELRLICGVAAISLGSSAASGIVWVRPELRREVSWGGDPDKPVTIEVDDNGQIRLTPRSSFAQWVTLIKGVSRTWTDLDRAGIQSLLGLRQLLLARESLTKLSDSNRRFRSLVALQSDVYWQTDQFDNIIAFSKPLPIGHGLVTGQTIAELFLPYCDTKTIRALTQAFAGDKPFRALVVHGQNEKSGEEFEFVLNGEPLRNKDDQSSGWHGTITDVTKKALLETERKRAEQAVKLQSTRYESLLTTAVDGIHILDQDGNLVEASDSFWNLLGYDQGQRPPLNFKDWDVADAPDQLAAFFESRIHEPAVFESKYRRTDGIAIFVELNCRWVLINGTEYLYASARDITIRKELEVELRQSEARFMELARTDPLTGLANRRTLSEAVEIEFQRCKRFGSSAGVLMIDIDNFKKINDTYGHESGDRALISVGAILKSMARIIDISSRFGGEEFVSLLVSTDLSGAVDAAERIREKVSQIMVASPTGAFGLTVSIGVSILTEDDIDWSAAISRADQAMYRAKEAGRNRVVPDDAQAKA
jgi:diguanylate cyclase (GGDEF)-like protein/PAS domain S-box-containing protein